MDLSEIQSDPNNDVHSLEGTDGLSHPKTEGNNGQPPSVTSGAIQNGPSEPGKQDPAHKPPFLKRMWRRLNIYLLLFLLLVVIAIGITIAAASRSKSLSTDETQISSEGLSKSTLEQLANSDTTIGSPKQILTVSSNAVFVGSVLLRSNLEIAGTVKIGGELALPGITVSGTSRLGEIQANSLAVNGPASFQGVLTAASGLNVTGKSTFGDISVAQLTTGSLQLNGNLKLNSHITAGGPIPSIARGNALGGGGTASVSGSDTSGSVAISTGSSPPAGCLMTITFQKAFTNTPHVIITPVGSSAADLAFYVNRTTSNFSICTTNSAPSGATFGFDYMAVE